MYYFCYYLYDCLFVFSGGGGGGVGGGRALLPEFYGIGVRSLLPGMQNHAVLMSSRAVADPDPGPIG